ncbi:glycosyltransferase family 4 protein [Psychroflexus lacisalsi]|uniref:Colanic acid biosynthesis glycosyltransferase WcaL n=1 Tax=Psychroflexus lacisalsi TaxID=503928 RepID=A0ABN1KE99_9FLAO|nr:glycosyltransferase family 4 protein [Psychroflexus lacisalsi]MBZ9620431.1 glycosyltransferase family 4 protein [Psychroflexus lacisalsi]
MKITLVLSQPPGYSETFFRSKIKGLKANGHQVVLVTAATNKSFDLCAHIQHPRVYKNPIRQLLSMLLVFVGLLAYWTKVNRYINLERKEGTSFKRLIEKIYINASLLKLNANWIHFGFATMAIDRETVPKAIGAKLAVSFRGYDIEVFLLKNRDCYQRLWMHVDKVHSISNYLLEKAFDLGLSKSVDSEVIYPAIDFDFIKKIQLSSDTLGTKFKLLTIARLHWIKGIDDLIETAQHLKSKQIDFEWKVIGEGDQKHTERYAYHIYKADLQEQVLLLGKLSHAETLEELSKTEIYVQTSLSEGFCNAVLEAQALGKLCLAYDAGALSENIQNNTTGFLSPKGQPHLLAQKIIEVMQRSNHEKEQISQKAIQRVHDDFSLEQQAKSFSEFYTT